MALYFEYIQSIFRSKINCHSWGQKLDFSLAQLESGKDKIYHHNCLLYLSTTSGLDHKLTYAEGFPLLFFFNFQLRERH